MKKLWFVVAIALSLIWCTTVFAQDAPAKWIEPQWDHIRDTFTYEDCTIEVDAVVERHEETWVQTWEAESKTWSEEEIAHLQDALLGKGAPECLPSWTSDSYSYADAQGAWISLSPGCLTYRHPQADAYDYAASPHWDAGQWFAQTPNPEEVPPLEGLTFEQATHQVSAALEPLGLALGLPKDVEAWNRQAQQRMLEAASLEFNPELEGAETEAPCYRFSLPIYFEGWRLGPGIFQSPYGETNSMEAGIVEALVSTEGIRALTFAHALFSDAAPIGEPQLVMTAEQALTCYRSIIQDPDLYGDEAHRVEKMQLHYIPSWQEAAGRLCYTYKITPAWCFYLTWEEENVDSAIALPSLLPAYGEVFLHAVTGELLYP